MHKYYRFIIVNNFFKPYFCDIVYIGKWSEEKYLSLKMDGSDLKKIFLIQTDNITVIKLKVLAKQHGIKGYYKLRKAELIQKLEAHPDVNEQVLIPGLEIPRNITRSVNTSAIFMIQFWMITIQYYNQHKHSLPKAFTRSQILVIGCWITCHQSQRWLMKLSNR